MKLITANQDFEQELTAYAADVRNAGREPGAIESDHKRRPEEFRPQPTPAQVERTPKEPAASDRRTELRHPYNCKQWIAPYSSARAPHLDEFFRVQCRDISSGGISFFMDRAPKYKTVVIRLGGPEEPRYLTASIQQYSPSSNLAFGQYVVGCRFLGTLHALPPGIEEALARRETKT